MPPIVIYGAHDSPDTRAALRFFDSRSAPYTLKDTTRPILRQEMFLKYGVLVIPVIIIGKRAFFGFDANRDEIDAYLAGR